VRICSVVTLISSLIEDFLFTRCITSVIIEWDLGSLRSRVPGDPLSPLSEFAILNFKSNMRTTSFALDTEFTS
jgi:hypothetical protein